MLYNVYFEQSVHEIKQNKIQYVICPEFKNNHFTNHNNILTKIICLTLNISNISETDLNYQSYSHLTALKINTF